MSKMPTVKVNGMKFYTDDEYFAAWMWKVDQISDPDDDEFGSWAVFG